MRTMMNGLMTCEAPMMVGLGLVAMLLVATLALAAAATVKVLRSGIPMETR